MLFQIQKNLLAEVIKITAGALVKGGDPTDPAQYLAIQNKDKKLQISFTSPELVIKVILDKADDFLKLDQQGLHFVQGEIVNDLLQRTMVMDKITVDFGKGAAGESLKGEDPSQQPLQVAGNLILSFPNSVTNNEEWTIPCIDQVAINISGDPAIDLTGTEKLTVKSKEFSAFVKQVGMAVGKDSGDAKYRNVMIRTNKSPGQVYDIIGNSMVQLAWAKSTAESVSGQFAMTIPYQDVLTASRLLNPELNVEIIYNKGTPGTAVFVQDVVYGDKPVGKAYFRVTCSSEKFTNFEKVINSLSFSNSCKIKSQQIKPVCNQLDILKPARTQVVLDPKKSALIFSKSEAGRGLGKGIGVPATDIQGDKFEIEVSSRHLTLAVFNAEADEIEWKFSGPRSLSSMVLSPNLVTYFQPYTDDSSGE
jgi:hypothetical protein